MERARNIATVAHHWANGIGESGRASNLFFEGENIYSYGYHFLIAKHVYNGRGGHAVLVTQRKYSRSTSAHVTLVRNASRHLPQLSVRNPEWPAEELFDLWYCIIKGIAGGLANTSKPGKLLLEIRQVYAEAQQYAEFFDLEIPEVLQRAKEIENEDQYREVLETETRLRKAQEKREKAAALRIQKAQLKQWRAFAINRLTTVDGYDYLRFNKTSQRIETSQRVEIPAATGKQFYRVVMDTIAQGGCTDCNLHLMEHYEVTAINSKFIRVGCHKISLKEIRSFIHQQGW